MDVACRIHPSPYDGDPISLTNSPLQPHTIITMALSTLWSMVGCRSHLLESWGSARHWPWIRGMHAPTPAVGWYWDPRVIGKWRVFSPKFGSGQVCRLLLKAICSPSNCVGIGGIPDVQFESSIPRIFGLVSSSVVLSRPMTLFLQWSASLSSVLRYVLRISHLCHAVRFITISRPLFSSESSQRYTDNNLKVILQLGRKLGRGLRSTSSKVIYWTLGQSMMKAETLLVSSIISAVPVIACSYLSIPDHTPIGQWSFREHFIKSIILERNLNFVRSFCVIVAP